MPRARAVDLQMVARSRSVPLLVALLGVAALVAMHGRLGDYPQDAGPSVAALAHGHVLASLRLEALMGSVSIFLRAPFVALAHAFGAGALTAYQIGALVCLVPAALLGLMLARSVQHTRARAASVLVGLLAVASPPLVVAVHEGHPEEALGGALAVAAVVLAARNRTLSAGVVLGLALATKQWALVAIAPALLAAPRPARVRVAAVAVAVAVLCTLPAIAANPSGFLSVNRQAAATGRTVGRPTVWFLLATPQVVHLRDVPAGLPTEVTAYRVPGWVNKASRPLIVVASLLLALLVARRGRESVRSQALPLLALVFLLRCVLDPVDGAYYHLPLVLALLAWEAVTRPRRLPAVTLLTAAALSVFFDHVDPVAAPALANAVYLAAAAALAAYLASTLHLLPGMDRMRRSVGVALRRPGPEHSQSAPGEGAHAFGLSAESAQPLSRPS